MSSLSREKAAFHATGFVSLLRSPVRQRADEAGAKAAMLAFDV